MRISDWSSDVCSSDLTHMVRNALDHGIERPEERRAAGKPETGRIRLQAWHEGGHIILRIADDGRGLSSAKISEKIVKNGPARAAHRKSGGDGTGWAVRWAPRGRGLVKNKNTKI